MNAVAEQLPVSFHDSLILRARNLRFRGVGNPYTFLKEIGIVPIKEFIYRGATVIDLAEALNLPITIIRTWIEENNYQGELEEASALSAEGYIRQGELELKAASNKFNLDKAKAMIEHGRWMASKKDKKTYGVNNKDIDGPAAVSYTFNINTPAPVQVNAHIPDPKTLKQDEEPKPIIFAPLDTNPFTLDKHIPQHLKKVHSDYPVIVPLEPKDEKA